MLIKIDSNLRTKIAQVISERAESIERIARILDMETEEIVKEARLNVSGRILNMRSGALYRSIRRYKSRIVNQNLVTTTFGVALGSKGALHGTAWEEGYEVPPMRITPKQKRALSFVWKRLGSSGARSFATGAALVGEYVDDPRSIFRAVNRPAYRVAARPWLRPAIDARLPIMEERLQKEAINLEG